MIVVEGPWDAMRVYQAGFPNVVALWGARASRRQQDLLATAPSLWVMLDGDNAGRSGARHLASTLCSLPVRIVELPHGKDPANLTDDELLDALSLSNIIAENDDASPQDSNSLVQATLPADGAYTMVFTSKFNFGDPESTEDGFYWALACQ